MNAMCTAHIPFNKLVTVLVDLKAPRKTNHRLPAFGQD